MQAFRSGQKLFYIIDAKNQVAGRLASRVVPILIGKHKPIYDPFQYECGDHVIIINSKDIVLTGEKWERKKIRWHTQWPGGLKQFTAQQRHDKDPTELMRRFIRGMLPKNHLRNVWMEHLHVYPTEQHPHKSQQPIPVEPFGKDAVYYEIKF